MLSKLKHEGDTFLMNSNNILPLETKEHYKMYKSGKKWMVAGIVTSALFSVAILGNANASADTVSSTQSSGGTVTTQMKSATSSKTVVSTPEPAKAVSTVAQSSQSKVASVNSSAKQTAVKASSATVSTPVTRSAQPMNLAEKNSTPATKSQSQSGINVNVPHSDLDNAVANAKKDGVTVSQTATQNSTANANDANSAEQKIADDYKNQTNTINQADQAQKKINADNSHIGSEGDHSALDSAVASAKQAGVNVVQDSDQNVGSDKNASQWQDVNNQINSDYQNEVNEINNQVKQYQSEMNQYNQQEQAYQKAMDQYNAALADYNKKEQAYQNALKGLNQTGIAATGVDVSQIKQQLTIGKEPNATMKILSLGQGVNQNTVSGHDGYNNPGGLDSKSMTTFTWGNKGYTGDIAKVEYDNLTNSSYNGHKITKIIATFSNAAPADSDLTNTSDSTQWPANPQITVYSDPTDGFWYNRVANATVDYQFYDDQGNLISFNPNNAWLTIASLNHHNDSNVDNQMVEKATLDSAGTADQIKGSSVTVHNGKTLYSDNVNSDNPDTPWDITGGPQAYYGAGLFDVSGNDIKITYSTTNPKGDTPVAATTWVTLQTTIPTVPNQPVKPVKPTAPTKPSVPTVHYHYDKMAMQKEKAAAVSYHYDGLNITPVETKNVDVDGQSVNGKDVVEGEDVTFPLSSAPLPANRTDDVKTLSFTDTLDKNVKFDGWKAVDTKGNDVSKDFTMSQNGQTVTFTATSAFMNQINSNKGSQFDLPTIDIAATATASGVQINNTFQIHVNGNAWPSNKVTFSTPPTPKPVKKVDNTSGQDIDGNFVDQGQEVDFNMTMDLSGDKNVVLDKNVIAKGLSMIDSVDKRLTPNISGIVITDGNGKAIDKSLFNITDNNNTVTIAVKDPQAFLNTYGGQKINIKLPATVNKGISGNIPNTVIENHFGDKPQSNQVIIYVPNPTKGVAAGTIQGTSSVSINGDKVVQGQDITFTLNTTNLPAGRKEDVKSYQVVDKLDPNFDYTGYRAFLGSTDVTDEFTPTLVKGQDGQWTLTLTANQALLSAMNKDKSKDFIVPTIDIYGKAIKGGTTVKNSYVEKINNSSWTSNTVSVYTEKPGTPVKTVDNAAGQDADNGNVERGDSLIYHVSMDLTNTPKDTVLTPSTIQKGLWESDQMPAGVTVNTSGIRVNSADGKDITSDFDITYQNGTVKVAAKDPAAIIKEYGGTKLNITIPTTVNDNFTGDIKNTAIQNTFGNETESNTVVDHVPPMAPSKDVVVDLGNQNSLNGKSIALNSTFDYKLNSSTRPADYVGQTTEWGGKDMIDVKHDEFTGQWQVIADHPFVLKDGTTIKAGSDISKYFTMTFNDKTGEFDIEANKDFLDIMNLPANKKTAQGWSVFFQCKRIATGTAHNVWTETYNGKPVKSNTVTTTTPEPKKPATPAKPAPQPQKVVEKQAPVAPAKPAPAKATPAPAQPVLATPAPVKETPAPEKQAMPQTGESGNDESAIIGLAMLGAVGTMGLALKKKRFED